MISTDNLAARRGERLLFNGVNFKLDQGQALRITGANGTGKTTLLRILAGLTEPDLGSVKWCGEDIRQCRETFHEQLAYSGHQFGLRGELTALENLSYLTPDSSESSALIEIMERVGTVALHQPACPVSLPGPAAAAHPRRAGRRSGPLLDS